MIRIQPTIPGGTTQTFGADATITLDGTYNGGTCVDGARYVVAPAGVKPTSSSPAQAAVDGRTGHGAQANIAQGAANALDAGITYDGAAALGVDPLPAGSCIVKVESSDPRDATGNGREGLFEVTTALHVVASPPAFRAFAPVVWPSDDLANRPWRVADVDGLLADLPALSSSGAPSWASIKAFWDRLDFGLAWAKGTDYQYLTPRRIADTYTAYGRWRSCITGQVWGGICGNEWSASDKTEAIIRALSNGCQTVESYAATATAIGEDGGHYQWHLADCVAWIKATGQQAQYATLMPLIGGNVRGQYYQTTSGQFDPHDSAILPYIARRRTVSAITGSGPFVVTCTGYRPGSGLTGDTASNAVFTGLNMVRESNGATALITSQGQSGADWQFTVAALPSGLTASDAIYCAAVSPLSVGVYDWTLRNPTGFPNLPNLSPQAEYRDSNYHGNCILPISAMGMRGADLTPAKEYIERVAPSYAYGPGWQQTFWSMHQSAVLALPQDV